MILCLDVGNSQIYGGVFSNDELRLRFRHDSRQSVASDQLGVFLKAVLRENDIDATNISSIAIASVVPSLDYTLRAACLKYFNISPFFLQHGVNTGLTNCYTHPAEVGADRMANAIAASHFFPNQDLIVVDMGTATTFEVINKNKEYLGGTILAGIRLSMEALQSNTAKLSAVEIVQPSHAIGRSTRENIQSGLYFGQVGMIREITSRISQEAFAGRDPFIIGTGGFAYLVEPEGIFSTVLPDLVLHGIRLAQALN
jgi:type III pantothenate kinase